MPMSSRETVSSTAPVADRPDGAGPAGWEQSLPVHPSLQKHRALRASASKSHCGKGSGRVTEGGRGLAGDRGRG